MTAKRMLVNANFNETRVGLVDGQHLYDLDTETPEFRQTAGDIFFATVTHVAQSLNAVFVNYGTATEKHGFLPFKEVSRRYSETPEENQEASDEKSAPLKVGQEIIVQIEKGERGSKGAALTTFISLAGRYLVLMPDNPRAGGISRRIEGEERDALREALSKLNVPQGMGVIVRTAGVSRSVEELQWDLDVLLRLWDAIMAASKTKPAPFLIHKESNVVMRAIRDYLSPDISEIIIDDEEVYKQALEYLGLVCPEFKTKVKHYQDPVPLFNRYQIENQIETAVRREVRLPSGGEIVIDHTEALVSIDINSSKSTKGTGIEETALKTNLEAAQEIGRQLRLRDIGGLIVVDFIDMLNQRNQREVEQKLREATKDDRARIQIGRISRFGLLEMSRQRLRPSLEEGTHSPCPRCSGQGTIRNVESLSVSILRVIEEEAVKDSTQKVVVQLPVKVATYLVNEKRTDVVDIEQRHKINVLLIPNSNMETPQYAIERYKTDNHKCSQKYESLSYNLAKRVSHSNVESASQTPQVKIEQPVVQQVNTVPSPVVPKSTEQSTSPGLIKRLWAGLFNNMDAAAEQQPQRQPYNKGRSSNYHGNRKPHGGYKQNRRKGGNYNQRGANGDRECSERSGGDRKGTGSRYNKRNSSGTGGSRRQSQDNRRHAGGGSGNYRRNSGTGQQRRKNYKDDNNTTTYNAPSFNGEHYNKGYDKRSATTTQHFPSDYANPGTDHFTQQQSENGMLNEQQKILNQGNTKNYSQQQSTFTDTAKKENNPSSNELIKQQSTQNKQLQENIPAAKATEKNQDKQAPKQQGSTKFVKKTEAQQKTQNKAEENQKQQKPLFGGFNKLDFQKTPQTKSEAQKDKKAVVKQDQNIQKAENNSEKE